MNCVTQCIILKNVPTLFMSYTGEFLRCLSLLLFLVVVVTKSCRSSIGVPAIRFVEAITKDTRQANGGSLVYGFASHSQRLGASLC